MHANYLFNVIMCVCICFHFVVIRLIIFWLMLFVGECTCQKLIRPDMQFIIHFVWNWLSTSVKNGYETLITNPINSNESVRLAEMPIQTGPDVLYDSFRFLLFFPTNKLQKWKCFARNDFGAYIHICNQLSAHKSYHFVIFLFFCFECWTRIVVLFFIWLNVGMHGKFMKKSRTICWVCRWLCFA